MKGKLTIGKLKSMYPSKEELISILSKYDKPIL
jgi:hypothetical protein